MVCIIAACRVSVTEIPIIINNCTIIINGWGCIKINRKRGLTGYFRHVEFRERKHIAGFIFRGNVNNIFPRMRRLYIRGIKCGHGKYIRSAGLKYYVQVRP